MATVIDGKLVSQVTREKIANEVAALKEAGITPGLAVILVGNDPASQVYVKNKKLGCEKAGIASFSYDLPETTSMGELISLIDELNEREDVHGILVQLPLPKGLDEKKIIERISPEKDVDAFSVSNVGKIVIGEEGFVPCTPAGVMELLKYYSIDPCGKECVILGRSNIVGKPQALLMLHANATVTVCHSKTKDLADVCKKMEWNGDHAYSQK